MKRASDFVTRYSAERSVAEVPVIPSAKASDAIPPKPAAPMCDRRGRDRPYADIFFEANLVISRAARFKRATKILRREFVHVR
jgi:hypothetical protein